MVRNFGEPGISVYGRSPDPRQPGWQVRAPLNDMQFMEHNGRRYAVYGKEFHCQKAGHASYQVHETPVNHPTARTLLVEFAPGQFTNAGRINLTRSLEDTLNDELPRDPNGDPNGTLEQYLARKVAQLAEIQDRYQPRELVVSDTPNPENDYTV